MSYTGFKGCAVFSYLNLPINFEADTTHPLHFAIQKSIGNSNYEKKVITF